MPEVKWLYIQYLWREAEWVGHGKETDKERGEDCAKKEFQLTKAKLDRGDEETVKVKGWGYWIYNTIRDIVCRMCERVN